MSAVLGYDRGIQYSNDQVNRNIGIQNAIHRNNLRNLGNYNIVEKGLKGNYDTTEGALEKQQSEIQQEKGQAQGGEFLGEARNMYKQGKALNKIYQDTAKKVNTATAGLSRRGKFIEESGGRAGAKEGEVFSSGLEDVADDTNYGRSATKFTNIANDGGGVMREVASGGMGSRNIDTALATTGKATEQAFTGARDGLSAVSEGGKALSGGDVGGVVKSAGKGIGRGS